MLINYPHFYTFQAQSLCGKCRLEVYSLCGKNGFQHQVKTVKLRDDALKFEMVGYWTHPTY